MYEKRPYPPGDPVTAALTGVAAPKRQLFIRITPRSDMSSTVPVRPMSLLVCALT